MFHVEFIGLPGSGKSTISELVLKKLEAKNYSAINRQNQQEEVAKQYRKMDKKTRASSFVRFCEKHNDLVFELGRLSSSLRPLHRAGLRRSFIFLKQCQNADLFRRGQADVEFVVHDQDILQELWSVIYLRKTTKKALRPLVEAIAPWLPTLTVFIDLEGKVAIDRMNQRAKAIGHFTGEIDSMKNLNASTLDDSNRITKELGELAEEFGSSLLVINGLNGAEESARLVLERIESLFDA